MPMEIKDQTLFETIIKDTKLSVIHFQADWVEQCAQVNELLDALSEQSEFGDVKFYSCMAEELSEISLKYNIYDVPAVLLFRSNRCIGRVNGADATKITNSIKIHNEGSVITEGNLEHRLKSLINKSKVMLFMKGDRNTPRCGFSRQIIEILNKTGVAYETFDILQDEEVRQGLKKFSDWPTYPQLYVKGDLIGGLDIVKEMVANGELTTTLNS